MAPTIFLTVVSKLLSSLFCFFFNSLTIFTPVSNSSSSPSPLSSFLLSIDTSTKADGLPCKLTIAPLITVFKSIISVVMLFPFGVGT